MDIEFDPAKDAVNIVKHGVSLGYGRQIYLTAGALHIPSFRKEDSEYRWKAIGEIDGRLWTAIYVEREKVRFVSVRRSNDGEARLYHNSSC